jgi:hypothetical protein
LLGEHELAGLVEPAGQVDRHAAQSSATWTTSSTTLVRYVRSGPDQPSSDAITLQSPHAKTVFAVYGDLARGSGLGIPPQDDPSPAVFPKVR